MINFVTFLICSILNLTQARCQESIIPTLSKEELFRAYYMGLNKEVEKLPLSDSESNLAQCKEVLGYSISERTARYNIL